MNSLWDEISRHLCAVRDPGKRITCPGPWRKDRKLSFTQCASLPRKSRSMADESSPCGTYGAHSQWGLCNIHTQLGLGLKCCFIFQVVVRKYEKSNYLNSQQIQSATAISWPARWSQDDSAVLQHPGHVGNTFRATLLGITWIHFECWIIKKVPPPLDFDSHWYP